MMITYHIHCGAVVRISPGVPEVPGSNPEWNIFPPFLANYHYTNYFFILYSYSGWSLGVAVPGIYGN